MNSVLKVNDVVLRSALQVYLTSIVVNIQDIIRVLPAFCETED